MKNSPSLHESERRPTCGKNAFHPTLYLQVRDNLAQRIATGEWKPGDTLPNEFELAWGVGVSSGTMRKSLDLLESEHLVTRRQGRGTFVNDPSAPAQAGRYTRHFASNGERQLSRVKSTMAKMRKTAMLLAITGTITTRGP